MSKNGLIATPTVDKNGRSTTVYRKDAPTAAVKPLPAPTLAAAKRGPQKPFTPLPAPRPLSEDEYKKFLRDKHHFLSLRCLPSRKEAALIQRIRDDGYISDEALKDVSDYMGMQSIGERVSQYDYNAFLLAERVSREEGDSYICTTPTLFADAVEGLARRRREADSQRVPLIDTEEELDAHAAVVRMLLVAGRIEPLENPSFKREEFKTSDNTRHSGMYFKSHAFTAMLRERPEDYRRVEGYVRSRGTPRTKADVELLREYLDSEHAVQSLAEGWL